MSAAALIPGPLAVEQRLTAARRLLEEFEARRPELGRARVAATGLAELDEALGGGLPLGSICEIAAERAGTRGLSLALRLARGAADGARAIFVIDLAGDFYPPAAAQLGVSLERLVIVRPGRADEAVWATEQILRCGGAGPVVARLGDVDVRAARRLQLAAEASGGVGLLVGGRTHGAAGNFAAVRMVVKPDGGAADAAGRGEQCVRLLLQRRRREAGAMIQMIFGWRGNSAVVDSGRSTGISKGARLAIG